MSNKLAIVLAAGKGTRMKSDLPKVAIRVCGKPMIQFVVDAIQNMGVCDVVVVVGYRAEAVRDALAGRSGVEFVLQEEQLGTGHAVQMCCHLLSQHEGSVLIVTGDSPLIQQKSIGALMDLYDREHPACILGSAHKEDPSGLGRIVRDSNGNFAAIVEEQDATDQQRLVTEVNMSTYVFDSLHLQQALEQLSNKNEQGEYYITDCPGILQKQGHDIRVLDVLQPCEALSINTFEELRIVEAEMRRMGYES